MGIISRVMPGSKGFKGCPEVRHHTEKTLWFQQFFYFSDIIFRLKEMLETLSTEDKIIIFIQLYLCKKGIIILTLDSMVF
jgi:hypothetical protein